MRAIFDELLIFEQINPGDQLTFADSKMHHVIKVARTRVGEEVLILDGNGHTVLTTVLKIDAGSVILEVKEKKIHTQEILLHLALGLPKKEALETIVRSCVEIGINKIIPLKTRYSQLNEVKKTKRMELIIENAMIQSNNPFRSKIDPTINLDELERKFDQYDKLFYFSSTKKNDCSLSPIGPEEKVLFIIGPEGGFALEEEDQICNNKSINTIHLSTPILRAPTAACVAAGLIHGLRQF